MGNNVTLPPKFGCKSSNSPFFTPVKNAVISARVHISKMQMHLNMQELVGSITCIGAGPATVP